MGPGRAVDRVERAAAVTVANDMETTAKRESMKLSDIIHAESIIPELTATSRNGVIRELVQSLVDHGSLPAEQFDTVARSAIKR